jgi:hypothetical protein
MPATLVSPSVWGNLKHHADNGVWDLVTTEAGPKSGSEAGATGLSFAKKGSTCLARDSGIMYVNEGDENNPYWTPVSFDQPGLLGVREDFRGPAAGLAPIADTTGSLTCYPSGMRVFGQGMADTDSGLILGTDVEGSRVGQLTTTNEDEHVAALGMGGTVAILQPDTHGPMAVDILCTNVTDILAKRMFIGFLGTVADALEGPFTGATTVVTLVQDDMAGICFDANFTDADALYGAHNKSNADATMTGIDLSTNMAAAGTYQRFRVEIYEDGDMRFFVDKVQKSTEVAVALDVDEEVMPVALIESDEVAIQTLDIKQFMCWGLRS